MWKQIKINKQIKMAMNMIIKRPLLLSRPWPHVNQALCLSVNYDYAQIPLKKSHIRMQIHEENRNQVFLLQEEVERIAFHKRQNPSVGLFGALGKLSNQRET